MSEPKKFEFSVSELAKLAETSVRTTRYYASIGLLSPPDRVGRVAVYREIHLAQLRLIQALQEHGLTLAAVERYMSRISSFATVDELDSRRTMITSWFSSPNKTASRAELTEILGREINQEQIELLLGFGLLETDGPDKFLVSPAIEVGLFVLDFPIPHDGLHQANAQIKKHTDQLAAELTQVFEQKVRHAPDANPKEIQTQLIELRALTLQSILAAFQQAADQVIQQSIPLDEGNRTSESVFSATN